MKGSLLYFTLLFVFSFSAFSRSSEGIDDVQSKEIIKLVKTWSKAHDEWDFKTLKDLYADILMFYTRTLPASEVLSKITNMFKPKEIFKHKIISEINLSMLPNGYVLCEFTKKVTKNEKTKSYPSYLVVEKQGDQYLIKGESDYITDKNLNYTYNAPPSHAKAASLNDTGSSKMMYWFGGIIAIASIGFYYFNRYNRVKPVATVSVIQTNYSEPKEEVKPVEKTTPVPTNILDDDDNLKKGHNFESYIVGKFDKTYFNLLDWRGDKGVGEHYPEANKNPDLEWEFSWNGYAQKFAIECKYRSNPSLDQYEICRPDQLENYRKFEKKTKMQVYIVLGVGGEPLNPKEIFLIPLPKLYSTTLYRSKLKNYYKRIDQDFFFNRDIHCLT